MLGCKVRLWVVGLGMLCGLLAPAGAAAATGVRPISVTVTDVRPAGNEFADDNDQYVRITIDGKGGGEKNLEHCSEGLLGGIEACGINCHPQQGNVCTEPVENDVTETVEVLACKSIVTVRVRQWERDSSFFDSTDDPGLDHSFELDLLNPPGPQCVFGSGGLCFTVSVNDPAPEGPDSDGDGLLDVWETSGYDANCDGVMTRGDDVFLHEMGANPSHKDLFIEMNWFAGFEPRQADIDRVRQAFAFAPSDAGGVENPDHQLGITLHLDAGTYVDPATGNQVGDALSINAEAGRDLGDPAGAPGGIAFTAPQNEADLLALVADLQQSPRRGIFRFVLQGPTWSNDLGGIAPGFGDIVYIGRRDGAGLLHELGHSLGLQHGGFEGANCKPNHVSIMNYSYDSIGGIPWSDPAVAGGAVQFFIDFAPSRIPDLTLAQNPRIGLLGDLDASGQLVLDENNVQEDTPLLVGTPQLLPRHQILFADAMGANLRSPLGQFVDWNQNLSQDLSMMGVVNQDLGALDDVEIDTFAAIPACVANTTLSQLRPYDEWSNIRLRPGTVPGGEIQMLPLNGEPLPTDEEIAAARASLNRADLRLDVTTHPEPPHVGQAYFLTIGVTNLGPNPADLAQVRVALPDNVIYVTDDAGCEPVTGDLRELVCPLGTILRGQRVELEIETLIAVGSTGGPQQIDVQTLHLAGADTDMSNNATSIVVQTIPAFASFEDVTRPWVRSWTNPPGTFPLSGNASQGAHSLAVSCGYSHVESPTFDTTEWGVVGDQLLVDVFVPASQSNPWWVGDLSLSFDLPAAGIYNAYLGNTSLTALARGGWSTIAFAVSPQVRAALLGDYPDARFRFGVNVGSCLAPLLLDNVRFGGTLAGRSAYHTTGSQNLTVASTGAFTFDSAASWSSEQVTLTNDSGVRSQGSASLAFTPTSWLLVESNVLHGGELGSVTSRFNVDVYVPELPADPYWVGHLQLYFECPSAGLYNHYSGQVDLTHRFDQEFNSAVFSVPASVVDTLRTGPADCKTRLAMSVNPAWGTFRFDRAGFVQQ